jgi:hypothetical protein
MSSSCKADLIVHFFLHFSSPFWPRRLFALPKSVTPLLHGLKEIRTGILHDGADQLGVSLEDGDALGMNASKSCVWSRISAIETATTRTGQTYSQRNPPGQLRSLLAGHPMQTAASGSRN